MAEEKGGAERTEEPTPKRRQEDLEQGDAAISQEAGIAASLLVLFACVVWLFPGVAARMLDTFRDGLRDTDLVDSFGQRFELTVDVVVETVRRAGFRIASAVLPLALFVMVVLVGVSVLQTGPRFDLRRLRFNPEKLNPLEGVKRLFSVQVLVTMAKSLVKGLGVITLAAFVLKGQFDRIWMLPFGSNLRIPEHIREIAQTVLFPISGAMAVLAMMDFAWMRYRKEAGLKMSKQEIREEQKADVGDPHVRQARRQRMREMVTGRPLPERLKEATVVATNPTHYAVALRYWPGKDTAPFVVAKGKDFRAGRIKELALEYAIPVIEDKPLARGLYSLVDEGDSVPRELFDAVARLLAVVYRRRGATE